VSLKLRQTQAAIDKISQEPFDLHSYFTSETHISCHNIRLKSVVVAIVQNALFERYVRFHPWPKYVVGMTACESVFELIFSQLSLEEFLKSNALFSGQRHLAIVGKDAADILPMLSGIALPQFQSFELKVSINGLVGQALGTPSSHLSGKLDEVLQGSGAASFIVVGSVTELSRWKFSQGVSVVDSIELDPVLPWYWNGEIVRDMAVAQ
jgi:hypothetical protein